MSHQHVKSGFVRYWLGFSRDLINCDEKITLKEICDNIKNYSVFILLLCAQIWLYQGVKRPDGRLTAALFVGGGFISILILINAHHTFIICQKLQKKLRGDTEKDSFRDQLVTYTVYGFALAIFATIVLATIEAIKHTF